MTQRPEELVWVTGTLVKSTRRALIVAAIDKRWQRSRHCTLARSLVRAERPTPRATSTDWQVPQWWAYQNKLEYAHA